MPVYTYTTLDDPKATGSSEAFGINNAGQIVGGYDFAHGFLYRALAAFDRHGVETNDYQVILESQPQFQADPEVLPWFGRRMAAYSAPP
jgi:hypothetical protein